MERKFTILRYISYSLEILILYILQGTPNLIPEIFGGKPVLLLAVALTIAAFEKEVPSMVFGLICGMLCDLAVSNTIGYFAIAFLIICYFETLLFKTVMVKNFINTMVISFCACVLIIGIYFLFFYVFQGYGSEVYYFMNHYVSRIVYTFLTCLPIYFINKFLYSQIKEKI